MRNRERCVLLVLWIVLWTTVVHVAFGCSTTGHNEGSVKALPSYEGNCDFHNTLCCYTQGTKGPEMSNWTATPEGASVSQNMGTGNPLSISHLESPVLNFSDVSCVEFSFISFLPARLNLLADNVFSTLYRGSNSTASHGSPVFSTIHESTAKLIFEAVGGGGPRSGPSGVILKNVRTHVGNCTGPECSFDETPNLCGWESNNWDVTEDDSHGMVANLVSPEASGNLTTNLVRAAEGCLHFDFFMDTVNDTLSVYIQNGTVQHLWTMVSVEIENVPTVWSSASLRIASDAAFKVIFEARRCSTTESKIRIDNVSFSRDGQCDFSPPEAHPDNSLLEAVYAECGRETNTTTPTPTMTTTPTTTTTMTTTPTPTPTMTTTPTTTTTAPTTSFASNTATTTNTTANNTTTSSSTTDERPPTSLGPADTTTTGHAITTTTADTTTTNSPATTDVRPLTSLGPADTTTTGHAITTTTADTTTTNSPATYTSDDSTSNPADTTTTTTTTTTTVTPTDDGDDAVLIGSVVGVIAFIVMIVVVGALIIFKRHHKSRDDADKTCDEINTDHSLDNGAQVAGQEHSTEQEHSHVPEQQYETLGDLSPRNKYSSLHPGDKMTQGDPSVSSYYNMKKADGSPYYNAVGNWPSPSSKNVYELE